MRPSPTSKPKKRTRRPSVMHWPDDMNVCEYAESVSAAPMHPITKATKFCFICICSWESSAWFFFLCRLDLKKKELCFQFWMDDGLLLSLESSVMAFIKSTLGWDENSRQFFIKIYVDWSTITNATVTLMRIRLSHVYPKK